MMNKNSFIVPIENPTLTVPYDWNSIIFQSQADNEPLSDVRIITTKSAYKDAVYEIALERVLMKYPDWGYRSNKRAEKHLRKVERELAKSQEITVREFVDYREDGTYIVSVNVEDINGEDCIDRALELISMYRKYGSKEEFGKPVQYLYEECWTDVDTDDEI
ncbi:MAG: hypothetical protein JXR12_15260 [Neptunomonas phycophila]|uniref:hypothetical protein n=1 Tax=Neptunomonas phycophila TaxID=1572645 RepID=UPI003B8B71DD